MEYAKLVSGISDIVRYELGIEFDKSDIHYQRFLTHLKFFVERYFEEKMLVEEERSFFEQIATLYPKALTIAFTAKDYVELLHKTPITKEEVAYLTVHINRLMNSEAIDQSKSE
ncbi:PRD domain-containing protein [Enterococcus raffinosus]